MEIHKTEIDGVLIIEPRVFKDQRGFFMETYNHPRYAEVGIHTNFVQDNLSFSTRSTLRGLHFQISRPQAKLVQVLQGEVFDVAVDLRTGSPTFGRWAGAILSSDNRRQFYIPGGFAHGFAVLSDTALFAYKCNEVYHPEDEGGLLWSDPSLAIDWQVEAPVLSEKDAAMPLLADLTAANLPRVKYLPDTDAKEKAP